MGGECIASPAPFKDETANSPQPELEVGPDPDEARIFCRFAGFSY
jgi:hypothetical protein